MENAFYYLELLSSQGFNFIPAGPMLEDLIVFLNTLVRVGTELFLEICMEQSQLLNFIFDQ
jgi:hypothetical protein